MSYLPGASPAYSPMKVVTSTPSTGQVISSTASTCDGSETSYTPAPEDDTVAYQYTFFLRSTDAASGMLGRAQFTLQESTDNVSWSDVSNASSNQIFLGSAPLVKRLITLRFLMSAWSGLKYFRVRGHSYNTSSYDVTLHLYDYWSGTPSMIYNPTSTIYSFREAS